MPSQSRLRELFEQVSDLSQAQRQSALDAIDATPGERAAVATLLQADRADAPLFDSPAATWIRRLDEDLHDDDRRAIESFIGQHVGPFCIVEHLGKGGSSMVFRATRPVSDGQQTVALKVLHSGLFSPEARRRFRREQSILAQLSHANIARLIDGGITASGVPYIAMELIQGKDVVTHADEAGLDRSARLRLLIDVCRAVEAAHRALIVHRDLKPSNVMVTAEGHVKVLDFGIAKLLDDDAEATATEHVALTPGYAAPEQYERGPTTTSTDVYALGVLAGELLTGGRLGPGAIVTGTRTRIRHAAASTRRRRALDAELVEILRAALASEPERRYPSAGHLADDIARYLRGEPIAVRPMSMWYRTRKFVVRNRTGVAMAAVLALILLAAAAGALWQERLVRQEAARANAARDLLVSIFESAGADLPREQRPSMQDLVERASSRLATQDSLAAPLRVDLTLTLAKVARGVGNYEQALRLLDGIDPLIADLGGERDAQRVQENVLRAAVVTGSTRAARVMELLGPMRAQLAERRDATGVDGLLQLSDAAMEMDRVDESLQFVRQAQAIASARHLDDMSLIATIKEARVLFDVQRFRDALARADAALTMWHAQGEPASPAMIDLYGTIGLGADAIGDIARAETAYRQAIALGERYFDKPNPRVAWTLIFFGGFLVSQGRFEEAEQSELRGQQMRSLVLGDADPDTLDAVSSLARLYYWEKRFDLSIEWADRGLASCRNDAVRDTICTRLLALRARDYGRIGRFAEADRDIAEALAQQRELTGDSVPAYAWVLDNLLCVQIAERAYADAVATADRVLAIRAGVRGGLVQADLLTRFNRAQALYQLARNDEALTELIAVEPVYSKLFPRSGPRFDMLVFEARALDRAGRGGEARLAADQALGLAERWAGDDAHVVDEMRRLVAHAGH